MDQPKVERMLRLMMLLAGNRNYTIQDLADKLETSYRSIYRYLDTFKEAGFVVHKSGDYYHIAKESPFFKDISQLVHFTDEEAYMVNRLIDGIDNTNVIKQNLRRKLATIYSISSVADVVVKSENAGNVNALIEAIQQKKQAVLKDYASSHTGKVADRKVEPYKFTTNYISVWCYDLSDGVNKLFKTERMGSVKVLEKDWAHEKDHKAEFMDIFRYSSAETEEIELRLSLRAKNLIEEEYPLSLKYITQEDDSHWILKTQICSPFGAARFIAGLANDIEIIRGGKIRRYLHKYAKDLAKI
ncbi:MAG: WYL domain-containing transcriptional regulator [Bacteroidales bacterium]|nr:WYL domain-containing transcriptional regulator [Bacteroidales bacterium]